MGSANGRLLSESKLMMSQLDVTATSASVDQFSLWNIKLLETFFSGAGQGDEVWLQIDSAELDLIGPELGGDEGFLKAVRTGPVWMSPKRGALDHPYQTELVVRLTALVRQRLYPADKPGNYVDPGTLSPAYQGCKAPTYLPYLAALVRSSALYKEGYYKHLRKALALPEHWNSTQLAQLDPAWYDLGSWTTETKGRFGRFVPRTLGGHAHVGLPRAQCFLSRQDREEIGSVFELAGLRRGQVWSRQVESDVLAYASEGLSKSFRDAVGYKELRGPIQANLKALFEEWDGPLPASALRSAGKDQSEEVIGGIVELALVPGEPGLNWQVHWRVPPFREGSEVVLLRGLDQWRAPAWGTERCTTVPDANDISSAASRAALLDSAAHDVLFDARLEEEGSEAEDLGKFALARADLRVLVWGVDYATQREELQEHPLPKYGCAYLLATPRFAQRLLSWLGEVEHQLVGTSGLPPSWVMACVNNCGGLSKAKIDALPGIVPSDGTSRILAIVGGRSVRRASKRQYLSYDLPSLELDAPPGTILRADAMVDLAETASFQEGRKPGVRRFRVSLRDTTQKSFRIAAFEGIRELASVTLRVASDNGQHISLGREFSLDRQGHPQGTGAGLRGSLAGDVLEAKATALVLPPVEVDLLGDKLHPLGVLKMDSNPATLFLDSLARHGSMAWGTAKEQMARLLARVGGTMQADKVLLDLRCRGHLEIATNSRGHFTRIHAVHPAIYALPMSRAGVAVHTILGSLSRSQWRALYEKVGVGAIHQPASATGLLPAWRIVGCTPADIERIAATCNMHSLDAQALCVATWAATCDEVRVDVEQGAVESVGALEHHPQRFHPGTGCFHTMEHLAPCSDCDLFRMDDRDIEGGRVYVLATRQEGRSRYGFIRDSRWGIWIAMHAFARWVKQHHCINDACPWPLPYSARARVLFLPARMSLPVVLERALVLCSGMAPEVVQTTERIVDGRCVIVRQADGKSIAAVSQVYNGMAAGKWLLYRSVPPEVAQMIASKLGASLATT